jgi:hypothetical protein
LILKFENAPVFGKIRGMEALVAALESLFRVTGALINGFGVFITASAQSKFNSLF